MKNKKLIGLILVIIIVICGTIIYNKKTKNNSTNENTKTAVTNTNVKSNSVTTTEKPKLLTQKEIAEKDKEAAEKQKIRNENAKKYVSLEEAQDYIANESTTLLIKEFPNEKANANILNAKMKDILKTSMTPSTLKDKFSLNGPKYDLNQFDVELSPNNDLKFALNISTNELMPNTNKYIFIARTFSAE